MRLTKAIASGPRTSISPMCETSKRPAWVRVRRCSSMVPAGYWTGISQPPKSIMRPPDWRCALLSGVCFSCGAVAVKLLTTRDSLEPHAVSIMNKQVKPQASKCAAVRQATLWRNEVRREKRVSEVAIVDVDLLHGEHYPHRVGPAIEGGGDEGGVLS